MADIGTIYLIFSALCQWMINDTPGMTTRSNNPPYVSAQQFRPIHYGPGGSNVVSLTGKHIFGWPACGQRHRFITKMVAPIRT